MSGFLNKLRTIFKPNSNNIVVIDRSNFRVPPNKDLIRDANRILKENDMKRRKLESKYNYI